MDTSNHGVNSGPSVVNIDDYRPDNPFAVFPVISAYSRAQAIADGVLADISELARRAGLIYPTAITERVFSIAVYPPPHARDAGETEETRTLQLLNALKAKIISLDLRAPKDVTFFQVTLTGLDNIPAKHALWAKCGPGDTADPVITIMTIDED